MATKKSTRKKAVKKKAKPKKAPARRGRPAKPLSTRRRKKKAAGKKAGDNTRQIYTPPPWAWGYAQACLDIEVKPTISARCEAAGISRDTFYEHAHREEFVGWLQDILRQAVFNDTADVRQAHLKQCLKGELDAIRLWYERYGNYIPTERHIVDSRGAAGKDLRDPSELSADELGDIESLLARGDSAGKGSKVH